MKVKRSVVNAIILHAKSEVPLEACGYLAEKEDLVTAAFPMKNADASPEHFSFVPAEQFSAIRQMRSSGVRMCAVYHSHPATPARPSVEDIRLANDPKISYAIVSLAGKQPDLKFFRIVEGIVTPEPFEIED